MDPAGSKSMYGNNLYILHLDPALRPECNVTNVRAKYPKLTVGLLNSPEVKHDLYILLLSSV